MSNFEEAVLILSEYLNNNKDTEEQKLANIRKIIELIISWLDSTSE